MLLLVIGEETTAERTNIFLITNDGNDIKMCKISVLVYIFVLYFIYRAVVYYDVH